jgi:hypothetical protein
VTGDREEQGLSDRMRYLLATALIFSALVIGVVAPL